MNKLALLGGTPICRERPGVAWPQGTASMRDRLAAVATASRWGCLGSENERFAENFGEYNGSEYVLPVMNGTAALELIMQALEIGRGDEVILPIYTFAATATAIAMSGAYPVFCDIEEDSFQIDPAKVEALITPRTKAIIGVHIGSYPCDVEALAEIAARHDLYFIEDAAQAPGTEWKGRKVGNFGIAAGFSFQNSKNLTSGEGGAITTNDRSLYEKVWSLHHNGRPYGNYTYTHTLVGTNVRLSEWQAAILDEGLRRLDADIERRMANAAILDAALANLRDEYGFVAPLRRDAAVTRNAFHLYMYRYIPEKFGGLPREVFLKALNAEGVPASNAGYSQPIYEMDFLYTAAYEKRSGRKFVSPAERLPVGNRIAYSEGCWILQTSMLLPPAEMEKVVAAWYKVAAAQAELAAWARDQGLL